MRIYVSTIIVLSLLIGCNDKPTIEGLWLVKSVIVGKEEMTPNARWMRFNSDSTQQSGNGWFQHSVGAWQLDPEGRKLSLTNTNGLIDPHAPFSITIEENEMVWERIEAGDSVIVTLERTNQLPTTFGDRLLGLWGLIEAEGKGSYFSQPKESRDYLFFRWDKRFVIGSEGRSIHGVYQVHGHRPEVNMFPFSKQLPRNSWSIQFKNDTIIMKELNIDSVVSRTFKRVFEFPEK